MIRVFVGTSRGEDAELAAVLEYTLRKHASEPLDITWMALSPDPNSLYGGWNTRNWATPFTPFRWTIAEACNFEGRAIYMDVDTFAVADIAELWRQPIPDPAFALIKNPDGKLRTCVMLIDCAKAKAHLPHVSEMKGAPDAHGRITKHLKANRHLLAAFDGQWNCIDLKGVSGFDDPTLKIVHMSQMAHQPHLIHARARLAAQGRKHWYDGDTAPHWRPELTEMFEHLLTQAEAAGFHPAMYDLGRRDDYSKRSYAGRPAKMARA